MNSKNVFKFKNRHIRLFVSFKDSFFALLFSFIFISSSIVGLFMDKKSFISLSSMEKWKCSIVIIFIFLGAELYLRFRDLLIGHVSEKSEIVFNNGRLYLIYLCIIILMWLPVLLAYYPGLFAYDVAGQIPQIIGTYNTHHPLAHTLLLQFFYYIIGGRVIGSYNAGIVCYTIFQMIVLAMSIAYMHLFLYRMQMRRKLRIIILIFTGILPIYSVLSISITKDILFAAFFLILFLMLCYQEMMLEFFIKKHMWSLYLFSAIGTVLFRNNGIYGLIFIIIVSLFLKKGGGSRLLILSVLSVLLSLFLQGILVYCTHASKGSANEMLSVPYQQLSYVYNINYDQLLQEDIIEIESLIPCVKNYKLHTADPVKGSAQGWEHKRKFASLYSRLFLKYPLSYISAFLYNSMGYWYLFDTSNAEIYGYGLEQRQGYFLTDTKEGFGIEHTSYFPVLESSYENLFSLNKYQESPVLFILCSLASYFWTVVLLTFYAFTLKRKHALIPITFLLGYIITIYAGPCALIRYIFPIISCIPPLFSIIFEPEQKKSEELS